VRRLPGQAARGVAVVLHRLAALAITLAVVAGVGVAALAWRLSQGPLDVPWLAHRLEDAANEGGGPAKLAIGSVALAWEGFRLGVDRPFDFRLTEVTVTDRAGQRRVDIPRAEVSLSLHELLLGRLMPRAVELDEPRLTLVRAADGTLSLGLGSLAEAAGPDAAAPVTGLLAELARPPASDRGAPREALFSQLRRVRIRDAQVAIVDRRIGLTLRAPRAEIDLTRQAEGGVTGSADLSLDFGGQSARLTASATLAAGATETHLRVRLTPVAPAALAGSAPALVALTALDAPVSGEADLILGPSLDLREARLTVRAGAGEAHIGHGSVPIVSAVLVASGTPGSIAVQTLRVDVRRHDNGPPSVLQVSGTLRHDAGMVNADLTLDLDQVDFADVPLLWPEGIGGDAREWVVQNITAGIARNFHVDIGLAAQDDFSSVALTRASGSADGSGLTVHWLRPIQPVENGQAQLRILDPDTLDIVVGSGHQRPRGQKADSAAGGLVIRGGRMRITGLMQPHQLARIEADIAGSVPDAIALLREPRLALLDRHPIELKNPAGQATVKLTVGLPLEKAVSMDDIAIHAQAHLEGVHLSAIAAGRDFDQGVLDLDATTDGLKLTGRGLLAAIPARLDASMDFRAGPPTQVLQSVTVSGQPDARQLAVAGLDATSVVSGPMQLQAILTERRNGRGELAVTADLSGAELIAPGVQWRKPRDVAAKASAHVALDHDRLAGIDSIELDGTGLAVRGAAQVADGRIALLRMDRLTLGRTEAQGTARFPATAGAQPIAISLNGPAIDLTGQFTHRAPEAKSPQPTPGSGPGARTEPPPGPPWTLDARFERAMMAQGRVFNDVTLHAENDGRVFGRLRTEGLTGTRVPFQLEIVPETGSRRLTASTADAGELLRGLDMVHTMEGGRLSVQGSYDDRAPGRPLSGTADIEDFRIRNAPALAKLLQAMTLYGLVEVMQGPGLGFSRLVAPFRLTESALELSDARAFSPSLGLTMKGRIDLDAQELDMQGTIVPAYFFNALLGNIPLVGKLFSPERGGGVFAASYTLRGPLQDPQVFVNPLAALTPGFLRGLFGMF